ncbi:hypothetical protein ACFL6G_09465 [candidate division KSB1 bacterium]
MIKKPIIIVNLILIVLLLSSCTGQREGELTEYKYLSLNAPGMTPELFAPEFISVEDVQHCFPAISPDGLEVYWMHFKMEHRKGVIMFTRCNDGGWTKPDTASFSGKVSDHAPVVSPDGKKLYFVSDRPGGFGKGDIWFVNRTEDGWSEPQNLGAPVNSDKSDSQPTFTRDGTIYFARTTEGLKFGWGIYRSRLVNGKYTEPELLPDIINTKEADYSPYISPDESYLIFASGREGRKSTETDLYISFRSADDTWSEPVNMGDEINNGYTATFPFVSYDGKYLFFNRFNESGTDAFYWVDAGIINLLKPDK